MYFYLSLGSNIDAEHSATEMVKRLLKHFDYLGLFPFRYTEPEGIVSDSLFVNALVILFFQGGKEEVKKMLNTIEIEMGRDRSDPLRSYKGRCADIDILGQSEQLTFSIFEHAEEPYVQMCYTLSGVIPDLSEWGLATHERPASVDIDALTGDIRIVEDELNGFQNRVEATFER